MRAGENPIATARTLSDRFGAYKDWEFARLARTEASFAQNRGMVEEWESEGFSRPVDPFGNEELGVPAGAMPHPPFHPNGICGIIPDPQTGYLLYDVAVTACDICQSMLAHQARVLDYYRHPT